MFNSKNWLANALMSNPLTRLDDANLSLLDAKHNKKKKMKRDTEKKPFWYFTPKICFKVTQIGIYSKYKVLYNFFKTQKQN